MSAVLLQYVIALSSALTATGVAFLVREVHAARKTIYDNEKRSEVNRAVLRQEGLYPKVIGPEPIEED